MWVVQVTKFTVRSRGHANAWVGQAVKTGLYNIHSVSTYEKKYDCHQAIVYTFKTNRMLKPGSFRMCILKYFFIQKSKIPPVLACNFMNPNLIDIILLLLN